jgi:hypothetical protein
VLAVELADSSRPYEPPRLLTRFGECQRGSDTVYVDRQVKVLPPEYFVDRLPAAIGAIVLIRLNDGATEVHELASFEGLVARYPFFLDVWNSDILVFDGKAAHAARALFKRDSASSAWPSLLRPALIVRLPAVRRLDRRDDRYRPRNSRAHRIHGVQLRAAAQQGLPPVHGGLLQHAVL